MTTLNNLWFKDILNFDWGMEDSDYVVNENINNKPKMTTNIDDIFSIRASYIEGTLVLKQDGSVWYNSNKIFDDAIMIDMRYNDLIFILKNDNSLWAYGNNYKFNRKTYKAINEPQKIMDNIKYVHYGGNGYLITIKNDGTLFQSQLDFIRDKEYLIVRVEIGKEYKVMDNVVATDIRGKYGLAVKEGGDLFYWKCEDVLNNENFKISKITDNVKYARLNLIGITTYVLKNDGSLWIYKEFNRIDRYMRKGEKPLPDDDYEKTTPFENGEKIHDNVYAIVGDEEIFIIDQEGNLVDAPYYCEDWNVKKPEYN